jgi:TRAP-type uncharacterized transport system substrate-binding protein
LSHNPNTWRAQKRAIFGRRNELVFPRKCVNYFPCVINKMDFGHITVTHVSDSSSAVGTYISLADERAPVLDDADDLRVIPIVTYGAASNLDDLLYLRHVDAVMTQSEIFEYFRTRKNPNLENRIHYIIRLPVSEMHVLADTDIKSIEDLRAKKVSFGPAGSASSLTGTIVFQRLGVKVEQVLIDNPTALQKLKSGELAALVRVMASRSISSRTFLQIRASLGAHSLFYDLCRPLCAQ